MDRTIAISSLRTTTTDMVAAMMVVTTIVHNPAIKTTARHHHADVTAIVQCALHHHPEVATEDVMIIHRSEAVTTTMAQTTVVLVPDLPSMIVGSQIGIANVVLLRLAVQSMMRLCLSLVVLQKKSQTSKFW